MMTESKAWEYLAKRWDKPRKLKTFISYTASILRATDAMGLCQSVWILCAEEMISVATRIEMEKRLEEYGDKQGGDLERFFWSTTTKRGAASRATFCRRMAKKTAKLGVGT